MLNDHLPGKDSFFLKSNPIHSHINPTVINNRPTSPFSHLTHNKTSPTRIELSNPTNPIFRTTSPPLACIKVGVAVADVELPPFPVGVKVGRTVLLWITGEIEAVPVSTDRVVEIVFTVGPVGVLGLVEWSIVEVEMTFLDVDVSTAEDREEAEVVSSAIELVLLPVTEPPFPGDSCSSC